MLRKMMLLIGVLAAALLLAACDTDDSSSDSAAAQNLQPNLTGYDVQNPDNVIDTFSGGIGAAALAAGNIPLAAAIERVNTTLQCLQDVGAVDARIYTQTENVNIIPQAGVSLIVNQTRVERNILGCVTESPISAQATLEIQPCADAGSFTFEEENYFYAYIGAGDQLCAALQTHYNSLGAVSVNAGG